jgi:hypothetical protein
MKFYFKDIKINRSLKIHSAVDKLQSHRVLDQQAVVL